MQRTRKLILEFLKRKGTATLDQLAQEVGVVPMTVRAHLAVLERDGLVTYEEERGKIGRPRFVYFLTQRAQDEFPKSYDTLCNRILDALTEPPAVLSAPQIAEKVAETWAGERTELMKGKSLEERVRIMASIRTDEGAMASYAKTPDGFILDQCHCPASCVAQRHPDIVCAAEMSYIQRLLGVPVERVSWRLEGGKTCSYRVRHSAEPADSRDT